MNAKAEVIETRTVTESPMVALGKKAGRKTGEMTEVMTMGEDISRTQTLLVPFMVAVILSINVRLFKQNVINIKIKEMPVVAKIILEAEVVVAAVTVVSDIRIAINNVMKTTTLRPLREIETEVTVVATPRTIMPSRRSFMFFLKKL
jgi:hypothetical protein